MSTHEQALVSLISQLALSLDGAVLGAALAYAAVRSLLKFTTTSSALGIIRQAPSSSVSDLRSILTVEDSSSDESQLFEKIVVVRGTVEAKSAVDPSWKSFKPNILVSRESGDKGVVVQRTQTVCFDCNIAYWTAVLLLNLLDSPSAPLCVKVLIDSVFDCLESVEIEKETHGFKRIFVFWEIMRAKFHPWAV